MTDFGRRAGIGNMLKSVYDANDDGTVQDSDKLEASTKAQVQDHAPKAHAHTLPADAMLKSVYDPNDDGAVKDSDKLKEAQGPRFKTTHQRPTPTYCRQTPC